MFEYYSEPRNEWVKAGDLQRAREGHAVVSIGTQELPCLAAGGSSNREIIVSMSMQIRFDTIRLDSTQLEKGWRVVWEAQIFELAYNVCRLRQTPPCGIMGSGRRRRHIM